MKLKTARFSNNPEKLLLYLAQQNITPQKSKSWAKYPFELRRNDKTIEGQIGTHFLGTETTAFIIQCLGIHDKKSCDAVRKRIRDLRQELGLSK